MLITPHALVGVAIAVAVKNPFLAIPLSFGSHFVLDSIYHWQETLYPYKTSAKTWIRIPIDAFLAASLVTFLATFSSNSSLIFMCAGASLLPDIDTIACIYKKPLQNPFFKAFYNWHCRIQKETNSLLGLIPQIIISFIAFSLVYNRFI